MFELPTMTTVRVLDVRTLASKNRKPDEMPGMQLLVQATMPVAALAMFDPALPAMLARKAPVNDQGRLEGIEQLELTEIGQHVKRIPWVYDQTGNTIEFDRGLGGHSNLVLTDCTVHRVSFQPQEGVAAKVQWSIDAPALNDTVRGKLTGMKATELPMTQEGPEVSGQQDLDDEPRLTPAQLRAANTKGKTIEQKAKEVKGAEGMGTVAWPFPQDGKPGSGPNAKSTPPADATSAVLADVKKNGPGHSAMPKPKAAAKKTAVTKVESRRPAAYKDPKSGQTWTGRGLKPLWLAQALAGGAKLADFQVKAH